jgi:hypothetical protein
VRRLPRRQQQASEETRQATRTLTPPTLREPRSRPSSARRGWLVFATAAVVAVAVGVLPLLGGNGERVPLGSPDTTTPVEPPSTVPTVTTTPPVTCSGSGAIPGTVRQDLPAAVVQVRTDIMALAVLCDIPGLESLAARHQFRWWRRRGLLRVGGRG